MKSCLECLRNSKEARVVGVEEIRLSEMIKCRKSDHIGSCRPW